MPDPSTKNRVSSTASQPGPAPSTANRVPGTNPALVQPGAPPAIRISFNQQILIAYAEQVAILGRKAEELQRQVLELRQLLDHYQSTDSKQR